MPSRMAWCDKRAIGFAYQDAAHLVSFFFHAAHHFGKGFISIVQSANSASNPLTTHSARSMGNLAQLFRRGLKKSTNQLVTISLE
jgi:hypothetical protein